MTVRSTTSPAPTLEGYDPPTQQLRHERMLAQMRKLPKVDGNGFPLPRNTVDPSVTNVVEPGAPTQVPNMADALERAITRVPGADLAQLLDSQSFCAAIARISPADSAGLESAIRDYTPATAPGMAINPAQGHVGGPVPTPRSGSVLDQIKAQLVAKSDQPEPPGSTYRG